VKKTKSLRLAKETITSLTATEISKAAGGLSTTTCFTWDQTACRTLSFYLSSCM
jgi:hypothetical protein